MVKVYHLEVYVLYADTITIAHVHYQIILMLFPHMERHSLHDFNFQSFLSERTRY